MVVSLLFKLILAVLGWSGPTAEQVSRFKSVKKVVLVISHTSYADFWFMVLYRLAYPELFGGIRFVVKPEPFKHFSWILERLGCIRCTSIKGGGEGFVANVSKQINGMDECKLFISPKGTIVKAHWRTGYYYIAKSTKSLVAVSGFNYEMKEVFLGPLHDTSIGIWEMSKQLKDDMGLIVPLNPKWSEVQFVCSNRYNITVVDYTTVSSFVCGMVMLMLFGSLMQKVLMVIGVFVVLSSHISKESNVCSSFSDAYITSLLIMSGDLWPSLMGFVYFVVVSGMRVVNCRRIESESVYCALQSVIYVCVTLISVTYLYLI